MTLNEFQDKALSFAIFPEKCIQEYRESLSRKTMKKYDFTGEKEVIDNHVIRRIRAVRDFGNVKAGDLGGWVESELNLSHRGNCWVAENAEVFDNARVFDNAKVFDNARVFDNATVFDNTRVFDNATVFCDAKVSGDASVSGDAMVALLRDYIVFKNWWSSGRYFTWTRSNDKYRVGCFYGSGEELIKKAYADSDESGREYERVVRYIEEIKNNGNADPDE